MTVYEEKVKSMWLENPKQKAKNKLRGYDNQMDTAEDRIKEAEDRLLENVQTKTSSTYYYCLLLLLLIPIPLHLASKIPVNTFNTHYVLRTIIKTLIINPFDLY